MSTFSKHLFVFFTLIFSFEVHAAEQRICPASLKSYAEHTCSYAHLAQSTTHPEQRLKLIRSGIKSADACLQESPRASCYLYRAIHQKLLLDTQVFGYQKLTKEIINDAKLAVRIDPKLEQGAAQRLLGSIYLKAPSSALSQGGIQQNLKWAKEYAIQAMAISSNNLENQLLLAEVLVAEGDVRAKPILQELQKTYPQKRPWYPSDKKNLKRIDRLLKK